MIELIHGLPNNVVGITTRGRVTREDWDDVLLPAIDEALRRHEKVRLYYEIASRYPGAGWDAPALATDRLERIAVVSDAAWVKWVATALCFLIAGDVRIFTKEEEEESFGWITAPNPDQAEFPDMPPAGMSPSRQRSRRAIRRRHPKTLAKTPGLVRLDPPKAARLSQSLSQ